jgi:hypothetical protein
VQFVPLWTDILDRPNWKILDLPPELFRFWTFCLLAAQKNDHVSGNLPDDRTLARWFGMTVTEVGHLRDMAVTGGLIDEIDGEFWLHDWEEWRDRKDPGAARRKRKERKAKKELTPDVTDVSRTCHDPVTPMSRPNIQQTTYNRQHSSLTNSRAGECDEPFHSGDAPTIPRADPQPGLTDLVNRGDEINPGLGDFLKNLVLSGDPVDWVLAALKEAASEGKANTRFIAAIVRRYREQGNAKPLKTASKSWGVVSKPTPPVNMPIGPNNPPPADELAKYTEAHEWMIQNNARIEAKEREDEERWRKRKVTTATNESGSNGQIEIVASAAG